MNFQTLLRTCVLTVAASCFAAPAFAEKAFPEKPVRFVLPTAAGGATDGVARLMAEHMAKTLGQPVIVANMPGAATLLSMRHVVNAPKDGHTLGVMANTSITMPYVDPNSGYTPNDFVGISYFAKSPMLVVVSSDSPYKTLEDLITAARKTPNEITYASVGIGTTSHLPVELFSQAADLQLLMIPYKGIALAIPDIVSQRVDLMMGTEPSVGELIKVGKLRALAITSDTRSPSLPDTPTFKELGYGGASYELFLGMIAPAGTPSNVIEILSAAAEKAKQDPDVQTRLQQLGQELPTQNTAEAFDAFLRAEELRMKTVIEKARIQTGK